MLLWTMYEGRLLREMRDPQVVQDNGNGYQVYYICHKVTKSREGKEKQHGCGKAKKVSGASIPARLGGESAGK